MALWERSALGKWRTCYILRFLHTIFFPSIFFSSQKNVHPEILFAQKYFSAQNIFCPKIVRPIFFAQHSFFGGQNCFFHHMLPTTGHLPGLYLRWLPGQGSGSISSMPQDLYCTPLQTLLYLEGTRKVDKAGLGRPLSLLYYVLVAVRDAPCRNCRPNLSSSHQILQSVEQFAPCCSYLRDLLRCVCMLYAVYVL